uniref:Uncharacterized protein n=1 Tax=Coccidioides posadasii RMSCC 3488 TaxID=454284 RepID=A0A0J6FE07_COCPO|nr:hypothetical protein CPAG_07653 [Coccidioides posadasii RMSCC 3488]
MADAIIGQSLKLKEHVGKLFGDVLSGCNWHCHSYHLVQGMTTKYSISMNWVPECHFAQGAGLLPLQVVGVICHVLDSSDPIHAVREGDFKNNIVKSPGKSPGINLAADALD